MSHGVHFPYSMLQLFHLYIAKVDLDVAYLVMAMLQVYVPNVSYVSDVCCNCFILGVAKVDLNVGDTPIYQICSARQDLKLRS